MIPKADTKDLDKLEKWMHEFPHLIRPAYSNTLNTQAFGMKNFHIPGALDSLMMIRDKRFMNRQIKVNKAKSNQAPEMMFSEVGSIDAPRFTGWEEQETGKAAQQNRVATTAARAGNKFSGRMKGKARFKPGNQILKMSDINAARFKTKSQKQVALIEMARQKNQSFLLRRQDISGGRLGRFKPGLYGFLGKRLMRLQRFDKRYDQKRLDWMGNSLQRLYKRSKPFQDRYQAELERLIQKSGLAR